MATNWYREGTISVTNNSKVVVGSKTKWLDSGNKPLAGDMILIDNYLYEIEAITDNEHLSLFNSYQGRNDNNIKYAVVRNTSINLSSRIAASVAHAINSKQQLLNEIDDYLTSTKSTVIVHDSLGNPLTLIPIPTLTSTLQTAAKGVKGILALVQQAQASERKAQIWANASHGTEVEKGKYSAKHYAEEAKKTETAIQGVSKTVTDLKNSATSEAQKAAQSEANAKNSETAAAGSAKAAKSSETHASNSAGGAAASAKASLNSSTASASSAAAAAKSAAAAKASEGSVAANAKKAVDSATAAKTSETNSANNAKASAASKDAANTIATNAKASETNSAASAKSASDSKKAAANSASASAGSATAAAKSATAAAGSATNAANSATAAAGSESSVAANAKKAGDSATAAAGSATNASNSAKNAAASKSAATTIATNAKTSETNAAKSATAAAGSATAAAGSSTAAAKSATAAAGSATAAANSAKNAHNSEAAVSTNAKKAVDSAAAAKTSESNAAGSATAAAASKNAANTIATNAKSSETNSANSATAAAGSATNAANSATAAAKSSGAIAGVLASASASAKASADSAKAAKASESAVAANAKKASDGVASIAANAKKATDGAAAAKTSETNAAKSAAAAAASAKLAKDNEAVIVNKASSATSSAASALGSKKSAASSAASSDASSKRAAASAKTASDSATKAANHETQAKAWAVGPTPPKNVSSPSATNNVYHYLNEVKKLLTNAIATEKDVDAKTNNSKVITPKLLDYAIKKITATALGVYTIAQVNSKFLQKISGQVMTGAGAFFTFTAKSNGHSYIKGKRGSKDDYYLGRGSDSATSISFYNYNASNGINLNDDKTISYNAGSGGRHNLNGSAYISGSLYASEVVESGRYFQTKAASYPSLTLQGDKGVKMMLEFDAGRETTNLIHRTIKGGANHRYWRFDKEGRINTDKGVVATEANLGAGGYSTIWNAECPFRVDNLFTRGKGTSLYLPMLVGKARPSAGAWLAIGFGGYFDGSNTSAAAINVTDVNGKDQHTWLFKRSGDATGKAWVQVSDGRKKENIEPLLKVTTALDAVKSFSGKRYSFIGENKTRYGFIAQDLLKKYPFAVSPSGIRLETGEEMLGLDYTSIIPLHHEAIKELDKNSNDNYDEMTKKYLEMKKQLEETQQRLMAIEQSLLK